MHLQDFMPVLQVTLPLIITIAVALLVQRSDMKDLRSDLKDLRSDMKDFKQETNQNFKEIRADLIYIRERVARLEEQSRLIK